MEEKGKFIVFTADGCPGCAQIKEIFREEFEKGLFVEVDVSKDSEGLKKAQDLGVTHVPAIFMKDGDRLKKCRIEQDENGYIGLYCEDEKSEEGK